MNVLEVVSAAQKPRSKLSQSLLNMIYAIPLSWLVSYGMVAYMGSYPWQRNSQATLHFVVFYTFISLVILLNRPPEAEQVYQFLSVNVLVILLVFAEIMLIIIGSFIYSTLAGFRGFLGLFEDPGIRSIFLMILVGTAGITSYDLVKFYIKERKLARHVLSFSTKIDAGGMKLSLLVVKDSVIAGVTGGSNVLVIEDGKPVYLLATGGGKISNLDIQDDVLFLWQDDTVKVWRKDMKWKYLGGLAESGITPYEEFWMEVIQVNKVGSKIFTTFSDLSRGAYDLESLHVDYEERIGLVVKMEGEEVSISYSPEFVVLSKGEKSTEIAMDLSVVEVCEFMNNVAILGGREIVIVNKELEEVGRKHLEYKNAFVRGDRIILGTAHKVIIFVGAVLSEFSVEISRFWNLIGATYDDLYFRRGNHVLRVPIAELQKT